MRYGLRLIAVLLGLFTLLITAVMGVARWGHMPLEYMAYYFRVSTANDDLAHGTRRKPCATVDPLQGFRITDCPMVAHWRSITFL